MELKIKAPFMELTLDMSREKIRSVLDHAMLLSEKQEEENECKTALQAYAAQMEATKGENAAGGRPVVAPTEKAITGKAAGAQTKGKSRVESMFGAKESWNKPVEPTGSAVQDEAEITMEDVVAGMDAPKEKLYRGFVHIRCDRCGEIRGTCIKTPTAAYRCRCGGETSLQGAKVAAFTCNCCGKYFHYRTNLKVSDFEIECVNCKAPNYLTYNQRKNRYEGE